MDVEVSFGAWVTQQRKALDLTRKQLAQRVGCSVSGLRKIESDERRPSRQMAELLAGCLEIPPEQRPTFLKVARGQLRVERLAGVVPTTATDRVPGARLPRLAPHLPTPPTPLIGREPELATLGGLLGDPHCRLLTLAGPGGIGKTRLALEVASTQYERFPDGVYFVPLASLSSPQFIAPAIADALGFMFSGSLDPQAQLLNYLGEKCVLLVLDNLEHLLEGGGLLAELLQQAPGVKLLVTSRERLNLQGEWLFDIQGLPVPPLDEVDGAEAYSAVGLFVQSARRAQAGFVLEAEEQLAVSRICQWVEGMPLAIELAAAWVRILTCAEIVAEMERDPGFLSASARDMPERHRSLRAVFDHSWRLLSEEERHVLRQLSVFRGGFTREAAEQVAGASLPILSALVDKSLLRRTEVGRYDLHELIRQYAAAHLADDPHEETSTHNRHAAYYAALLQQWEGQLKSPQPLEALVEMGAELDNLRLSWGWMVAHQQIANLKQSLYGLFLFYEVRDWLHEGVALFGQAVTALQKQGGVEVERGPDYAVVLGQLLARQGHFCSHLGQPQLARDLLEHSLTLLHPSGDRAALADALFYLGIVDFRQGDFSKARRLVQEGLALHRALGDLWGIGFSLSTLGYIYLAQGAHREAHQALSESLAVMRTIGNPRGTAISLCGLGGAALSMGEYADAQQLLDESLAMSQALDDRWGIGNALNYLGLLALALGEAVRAENLFRESLAVFKETSDLVMMAPALKNLGYALSAQGAELEARQAFVEAIQTAIPSQAVPAALDALVGIAALCAKEGSVEPALELLVYTLSHAASDKETKDRAQRLTPELESQLTPQQIEAVREQAQAKPFDTLVAEILAEFARA